MKILCYVHFILILKLKKILRKFFDQIYCENLQRAESFTKYISNNQKHQLLITVSYLFQRSCKFIHLSTLRLKVV